MANISLYRGGTPVVKFMWCDKDHPVYTPPFRQRHEGTTSNLFADERPLAETPPYDSHADGAYNLGNFVIGMPFAPRVRGQIAQRKALQAQQLASQQQACCCEVKTAIEREGCANRELQREIQYQNKVDELNQSRAREAVLANQIFTTQALGNAVTTIINALKPATTTTGA